MAKYYKYTSKYNPYSFQEMWEPALAATQAHQQYALQLAAQEASAASLQSYLDPNSPEDAEMYKQYTDYVNGIRNASKQLSSKGLSSTTFNDVLGLTTQYATAIKPIEEMVQTKKATIQNTNQVLSEHPDYVLGKDSNPMNMPLSSFRYGAPQLKFISGNQIQNDVAMLSAIYAQSNERMTSEQFSKYKDLIKKQYGLTWDEFQDAMSGVGNAAEALEQIKNIVYNKYGVYDPNGNLTINDDDFVKLQGYAQNGLYSAIGKTESSLTESESSLERKEIRANQAAYYDRVEHEARMRNQAIAELEHRYQMAVALGDNETALQIVKKLGYNVGKKSGNGESTIMPEGITSIDNYYKINPEFSKELKYFDSRATDLEYRDGTYKINLGLFKGGMQGKKHLDLTEKIYKSLFNKDKMPQYITQEEYNAVREKLAELKDINSPMPITSKWDLGGFGDDKNKVLGVINNLQILKDNGSIADSKDLGNIEINNKSPEFYVEVVTHDMGNAKVGDLKMRLEGETYYIPMQNILGSLKNAQRIRYEQAVSDINTYNNKRQDMINKGIRMSVAEDVGHATNINGLMDIFKEYISRQITEPQRLKDRQK